MKTIIAAVLFAAISQVAVAAEASPAQVTATAPQKANVQKACYKEERIDADTSNMEDGTMTGPVTSALTRVPCATLANASKK